MKTRLHKENKRKEDRTSRKRSFIMYGILALVVISVAVGAVQISPEGSDNSAAAPVTWNGEGTQDNPYQISDAADLALLADEVNDVNDPNTFDQTYFILTDDIYLNVSPYNVGTGWDPIGYDNDHYFNGTLDGCGHYVAGLTINDTSGSYQGLFGLIESDGTVMNLAVVNVSINGGDHIGGVAGFCYGTIETCYVTGNLTAIGNQSYIGGIAGGIFFYSTIQNCYFGDNTDNASICTITGRDIVGGVVGSNAGTVQNCYSLGRITITGTGTVNNGGVVGANFTGGTVSNCFFFHSPTINVGLYGIGGVYPTNVGARPEYNTEMRSQITFNNAGWDFTHTGTSYQTWFMFGTILHPWNPTYPLLSWQIADHGTGTSDDPYVITTIQQLANINIFCKATTITMVNPSIGVFWQLGKDLDLTDYLASYGLGNNGGAGWVRIGGGNLNFSGNFDGFGYTIAGLRINTTFSTMGLFGFNEGGTIKGLGLVNVSISGGNYAGGIVGRNTPDSTIENCYVTGTVKGNNNVGGVSGDNLATVNNCYNMSNVEGNNNIGGIVGWNNGGTIENCYNTGDVKGNQDIGGITGNSVLNVANCYDIGNVTGNTNAGGVVGNVASGTVSSCFFLKVDGGINKDINGIGNSAPDDRAVPIGDDAMRTETTFTDAGWDFTTNWGIYLKDNEQGNPGYGYPYIKTIENFILVAPDSGSMVYGNSAPDPPGWSPMPPENIKDAHPLSVTLYYDPSPVVNIATYDIKLGSMDGPAYQLRFKDDVQYTITAPPPPKSYTITPTSDANSAITPSKAVTVQSGSSYTFTYSAASGYHISSVLVNGTALDQSQITGSYTFTNVIYNQTIDVKSASGAGPSGTGTTVTLTVDIVGGNGSAEYRIGSG
ncbi:MAG: hypothetical protein FWF07_03775, partial [Methanomassiliicoccaceae archaeon]|nr:hypothetical protein [Methanomassiliicoccaceae archaeon]